MAAHIHPAPQPQTLAAMRDHHRPLLVFMASGADPRYIAQLNMLDGAAAGMTERDMLLVPVFADAESRLPTVQAPAALLPRSEQAALRTRFGVGREEFRVVLIGKDGGEKFASETPVSAASLFAQIDAMPMRRRELEQRGR